MHQGRSFEICRIALERNNEKELFEGDITGSSSNVDSINRPTIQASLPQNHTASESLAFSVSKAAM
jgi:hypothetical protein